MSFWTTQKIRMRQAQGPSIVMGMDPDAVEQGSYELHVGAEAFVTSGGVRVKRILGNGEQVEIPPGQFAVLLTEEEVRVPDDAIAFISIKTGVKFRGLVNVSGFHVDPGFQGHLLFAVYNAGSESVILTRGQALFPMWFADLSDEMGRSTRDEKPYPNGTPKHHKNQHSINEEIVMNLLGEVASPSALKREVDELRQSVTQLKAIGVAVITAVLGGAAAFLFTNR